MNPEHDDHGGLHRDMPTLLHRREALLWIGGVSLAGLLAACSGRAATTSPTTAAMESSSSTDPGSPTSSTTTSGASGETATTALAALIGPEIPDEAAGPFPADGTNGPNILTDDGPIKAHITTSFSGLSGTAEGIATTLQFTVVDNETGTPLSGAVMYLWHCTADGRYSIYEIDDQNYLRGVQVTDDAGRLSFETVFPGCYPGRWPHCHFEVFASLDDAATGSSAIKTSQLAFPQTDCEEVYTDDRYGDSARQLARLSLARDVVFRDGWADQLATVVGTIDTGYTATLLVRV